MTLGFKELGISPEITQELSRNGIIEPTAVQLKTIPELAGGRNVIVQAKTGTGKTLAFILPMLENIKVDKPHIQALIVAPTRELAVQITSEIKKFSSIKGINVLAAYGGQDVEQQIRKLKGKISIVVGTPGRLLDHIGRKTVNFSKVSIVVLDEADQMLDMGFLKDVEEIMKHTPRSRQTALFSATISSGVRKLARKYMSDPVNIHIQNKNITVEDIRQIVIETTDRAKMNALCMAIDEYKPYMAIIFCRTKRRVSALNEALRVRGYDSEEIHGDLTQAKREKVMKEFRKGDIQFLVATDVAARGLDIEGVTHVFNYDIPQDSESYLHRIGRTGRAGEKGTAVTFVAHKDRTELHLIERELKITPEKRKFTVETNGSNEEIDDGPKKKFNTTYQKWGKGRNGSSTERRKDTRKISINKGRNKKGSKFPKNKK